MHLNANIKSEVAVQIILRRGQGLHTDQGKPISNYSRDRSLFFTNDYYARNVVLLNIREVILDDCYDKLDRIRVTEDGVYIRVISNAR